MKSRASLPRQVRIIGGQWKRTPLPVVEGSGLRPTPDRVRETLFNWLDHLLDRDWSGQRCLDLFAGTGALGFEAASRGAASVLMVESLQAACKALQVTRDKLDAAQVEIRHADALAQLGAVAGPVELIFLDPPYGLQLLPVLLPACRRLLAPAGLVYAESDSPFAVAPFPGWMHGWEVVRESKAGAVYFALLAAV